MPAPVVAKVAASEHRLGGGAWLARELEIGRFLAARAAPTARPTRAPPAGPHEARGSVVTLWEYVVHDGERGVDRRRAADALAHVHDRMGRGGLGDDALGAFADVDRDLMEPMRLMRRLRSLCVAVG